ncbi:MAG: hypothetical protein MJ180_04715, partial [Candidatus Gastranaerophilales bacterium]|nr:hypothetical protein [Candidatus Gastranaerophilales bacterium]
GDYVGGAVGQNKKTIEKCYSTGTVTGSGTNVGGFVGANTGSVENSFTTIDLIFSGNGGTLTNCYDASTAQTTIERTTTFDATHEITTDAEAEALGYTAIHSAEEFAEIKDNLSGKYVLMGDIDFSQVTGWGDVTTQSGFELNGNGYAIENFVINSSTNSTMHGLFRDIVEGSTVKNLNMENVSIESTQNHIGALCGGSWNNTNGTIDNCTMSGSVTGKDYTGGLVGEFGSGTITNSSASGSVTGEGYTGGLVGNAGISSSITNSSASGNVIGGPRDTGGLVGRAAGTITNSYATGSVEGGSAVGGLVGYQYGNISNSYALGAVSGSSKVGGAVGENSGTIEKCYSTGTVTGTGTHVGGFVGNHDSGNIQNCYSTQDIEFVGSYNIVGITNSHAAGDQTGWQIFKINVTGHDATWFENGENLSFLGDAFDTSVISPVLKPEVITVPLVQPGVTSQDSSWFENGDNLSFLGDAFDTSSGTPDLYDNSRVTSQGGDTPGTGEDPVVPGGDTPTTGGDTPGTGEDPVVPGGDTPTTGGDTPSTGEDPVVPGGDTPTTGGDTPTTGEDPVVPGGDEEEQQQGGPVIYPEMNSSMYDRTSSDITIQVGPNQGDTTDINLSFKLGNYRFDVTSRESAQESIKAADQLIRQLSMQQSHCGTTQNRLDGITNSLLTKISNMESSYSSMMDTDVAAETARYTKAQILYDASAALLAQMNTSRANALYLLMGIKS